MTGLRLLRPGSGLTQLSSVDICYQLSSWGSALLVDSGAVHPQPVVIADVTVGGTDPILAFRAANGVPVTVRMVSTSGGSITYRFQATSDVPVGLIYWCFDVAGASSPQFSGPRMQTWTSLGVKTFDSYAYAMRLSETGSGPDVAVVQSMYANHWEFTFLGETSGGLWIIQDSRSQTAARFNADGTVTTGIQPYAVQTRQINPSGGMPDNEYYGASLHTFIDITDMPRADMPSATSLSVGVSHGLRAVSIASNTAITTTSPTVTATVGGGTAPYTLEWQFVSGSALVVPNGAFNTLTFATKVINQTPGTTLEAVYRLRANDSTRAGWSQPVTFRHTVTTIDLTPDPIANLMTVHGVSNAAEEWFGTDYRRITGIAAPITLRFERYGYSGNADAVELWVVRSPNAITWTNEGFADARGSGLAYFDLTVQPGDYVGWKVRVATASGRRTAALDFIVIWNISDPAGPTIINSTPDNTFVVDNDDNHNVVDIIPDPIGPDNQTQTVAHGASYTEGASFWISGINTPITLRLSAPAPSTTGSVAACRMAVTRTTAGGAYSEFFVDLAGSVDVPATSGDTFVVKGYLEASGSSRATAAWTWNVENRSAGQNLASANVTQTVNN